MGFSELERRWQKEREARVACSARLRRFLFERGLIALQVYGVQRVWLFGSVLEGAAEATSDIDLLAVSVVTTDYWSLRRDLEAALNHPVDLYTQDDDRNLVRKVLERGGSR